MAQVNSIHVWDNSSRNG